MISFSRLRVCLFALLALAGSAQFAWADKFSHATAVFTGLDKVTGRILTFDVAINETVVFGTLQITPRVCYTRPQTEMPQTDAFVQVDEIQPDKQLKRVFSGWIFAASPGLHGLEHPIYDLWLSNCKGAAQLISSPVEAPLPVEPTPPPATAAPKPPRPKRQQQAAPPPDMYYVPQQQQPRYDDDPVGMWR